MKMVRICLNLIFTLVFFIILSCGRSDQTSESWKQDISILVEKVEKYHPAPWENISKDKFIASAEQIIQHSSGWGKTKIVVEVMKLTASLGDGHSEVSLNNIEEFNLWYPVRLELFRDGLYITGIESGQKDLLEAKVLKMGGTGSEEVLNRISELISLDDIRGLPRRVTNYISNAVILNELDVAENLHSMKMELLTSEGNNVSIDMTPEKWKMATNWAYNKTTVPTDKPSVSIYDEKELPLFLKNVVNEREAYWFEYLPEEKCLFFQFNDVHNSGSESFSEFIARMFNYYDENSEMISKYVIDIRFNEGGDGSLLKPLVHEFIKRSEMLPQGSLYIITGNNTFSAASNFIAQMINNTSVVTVGDIASGPLNWCSDIIKFGLPENNILVNLSTMAWQGGHPTDKRGFYPPEVYIPLNSPDFFMLRDKPLEIILENKAVTLKEILVNQGIPAFEDEMDRLARLYPDIEYWFPYNSFNLTLFAFQNLLPAGRLDEALALSKLNASLYPKNIRAKYITAMILEAKGENSEALDYLNQLAEIEPFYVEAVWDRDRLKAQLEPAPLNSDQARKFAGRYEGDRVVSLKENTLWYSRNGGKERRLLPLDDNSFFIEGSGSKFDFILNDDSDYLIRIYSYNGKGYLYKSVE